MKMVFYRCQAMHISCPLQIAKNIAIWPHLICIDRYSDSMAGPRSGDIKWVTLCASTGPWWSSNINILIMPTQMQTPEI